MFLNGLWVRNNKIGTCPFFALQNSAVLFVFCLACCDMSFLIVFSNFNLKNLGIRGFYHISGLSFEWEIFLPQSTDALSFFYHLLSYHFSG